MRGVTAGVATGLQFHPVDAVALSGALARLCDLYSDTRVWGQMQRRAMRHPVGWAASAPRYAALYDSLGTGFMSGDFPISAGHAAPLGATFDGDGVNFAVFSEHASRMTLCLFFR